MSKMNQRLHKFIAVRNWSNPYSLDLFIKIELFFKLSSNVIDHNYTVDLTPMPR